MSHIQHYKKGENILTRNTVLDKNYKNYLVFQKVKKSETILLLTKFTVET